MSHLLKPLTLDSRLALRAKEAADALGISERKFRDMIPELPHVRRGGLVLIPVRALERWLEAEATKEQSRADKIPDEIVRSFQNDSE